MPHSALSEYVANLRRQAAAAGHRRVLVLAGARAWAHEQAVALTAPSADSLWIGEDAPDGVTAVAARETGSMLGREFTTLVFDAFAGFDVDAFGAAAGTLCGGGLLLLLTPPLDQWPRFPDPEHRRIAVYPLPPEAVTGRFLQRLVHVIRSGAGVAVIEQDRPLPTLPEVSASPAAPPGDGPCRTADQAAAVAALERVVTGHRRRPLVLTSDRGRGKSAALGIAAARLLQAGVRHIVVTAPRPEAVAPVFAHAGRLLPKAHVSAGALRLGDALLEFLPPDELCRNPTAAGLVLVDEAAAIPAPLLAQLLQHHSRIAFATTVHGYEGTGRGFAIRFTRTLDRLTPQWKALHLSDPIRWAAGDPVEAFVFRALALDAGIAEDDDVTRTEAAAVSIERLDRDQLVSDESLLSQLFGLLVNAHYRTRPLDLRHLLDGPNVSVWVARDGAQLVGTALVADEGGLPPELAREVWAGRRRPHGHLLPEALAAHLGLDEAAVLRAARVMRIAVHPAVQGRGIGSRLLTAVRHQAVADGMDFVGTSFGATEELIPFWLAAGYRPVRLSVKRGAASGTHSALLLQSLSAAAAPLADEAQARFRRDLPHLLADPLRDLEPGLAALFLRASGPRPPADPDRDRHELAAFAAGYRLYESCLAPVYDLILATLSSDESVLAPAEQAVVVAKVLQRHDYAAVARLTGLPGRNQVIAALRKAVARCLPA